MIDRTDRRVRSAHRRDPRGGRRLQSPAPVSPDCRGDRASRAGGSGRGDRDRQHRGPGDRDGRARIGRRSPGAGREIVSPDHVRPRGRLDGGTCALCSARTSRFLQTCRVIHRVLIEGDHHGPDRGRRPPRLSPRPRAHRLGHEWPVDRAAVVGLRQHRDAIPRLPAARRPPDRVREGRRRRHRQPLHRPAASPSISRGTGSTTGAPLPPMRQSAGCASGASTATRSRTRTTSWAPCAIPTPRSGRRRCVRSSNAARSPPRPARES